MKIFKISGCGRKKKSTKPNAKYIPTLCTLAFFTGNSPIWMDSEFLHFGQFSGIVFPQYGRIESEKKAPQTKFFRFSKSKGKPWKWKVWAIVGILIHMHTRATQQQCCSAPPNVAQFSVYVCLLSVCVVLHRFRWRLWARCCFFSSLSCVCVCVLWVPISYQCLFFHCKYWTWTDLSLCICIWREICIFREKNRQLKWDTL